MPVYEFECDCGNVSEELVPMGTKSIECPKCKENMKKIISKSSFILKGTGWAFDNYGLKSTKKINQ